MTILLVLCCAAGDEFEGTWLDDERHGHGIEVQAGHGKFKVCATVYCLPSTVFPQPFAT